VTDQGESGLHDDLKKELRSHYGPAVAFGVHLASFSRWGIGGSAWARLVASSPDDVSWAVKWSKRRGVPWLVVGTTANLLFDSDGLQGLVIQLGPDFAVLKSLDDGRIYCGASATARDLAEFAAENALTGLEHIVGIPGTLGGLLTMNGGSQRQSIGESVESVTALDSSGREHILSREECKFLYRESRFQSQDLVILSLEVALRRGSKREIRARMDSILADRRSKFPESERNCGSTFLSDPAMYRDVGPPGFVIENCGLKGMRVGDAQVSLQHANFVNNLGSATSADVLAVIHSVGALVLERTGYRLKAEAIFVRTDMRLVRADEAAALMFGQPSE